MRLVQDAANQRPTTVTVEGKVDLQATLAAREKQERIVERFSSWAWEEPGRAEALAGEYNRRFNSTVLPVYDGSHLSFPGLTEGFWPHQHQRDAVWRMLSEPSTLLAHDVGAGKTATMVIGVQEMRRLGMVAKPMVVVPNHMLDQFSREWQQLYPAARLLVADKDDVSPAERKTFVARCASQDWDAVIITQSSFERIPVSRATEERFLAAKVAELRAALVTSRAGAGLNVKALEKKLAQAEERHKALAADARRDQGGVSFEASGVDYLVVDEAHAFKNLTVFSRIPGAGGAGSKRAEDLDMKLSWLRERHGERVCTFATATPIANSIAEMWVMQHYLQPGALAASGTDHFDGWAATFGRTVTSLELSPDASTYRMASRFARFANVPELMGMFRQVADVRTRAQLGLALPQVAGGKPQTVIVAPSEELRDYMGVLAKRAEAIRARVVNPVDDNMLKVSSDGRKAALDTRLVGLVAPSDGGKLAAAADRIAAIYSSSAGRGYHDRGTGLPSPRSGALQLVFCDLGVPHPDGRWSAYDHLRAELIARGVPGERVRFVHEARNDAEKARLFAACRNGSVAVLIGSTEKMGVGTNVQDRAIVLHHLDCPWRPADLEQRDGRIIRQGNQNPEVQVFRYATEGSFDVYCWQTIERKAAFIAQVMTGDTSLRSIDDIGDAALSAAEVKALATGNPLIMERAGVEAELTKLSRLQAAHHDEQARLARRARGSERDAERETAAASQFRAALQRAVDISGDNFVATVGATHHQARNTAGPALQDAASEAFHQAPNGRLSQVPLGELAGFTLLALVDKEFGSNGISFALDGIPRTTAAMSLDELRSAPALGLLARIENLAGSLAERADAADQKAAEHLADAVSAGQRVGLQFEHAGRMQTLKERLAAIDAVLAPAEHLSPTAAPPTMADLATVSFPETNGPHHLGADAVSVSDAGLQIDHEI